MAGALEFNVGGIVFPESCQGGLFDGDGGALPNPASVAPIEGVLCAKGVLNNWPIKTSSSYPTSGLSELTFLARVSFDSPQQVVSSTFCSNALQG